MCANRDTERSTRGSDESRTDAVCRALADHRRRVALYHLLERGSATVSELVDAIRVRERDDESGVDAGESRGSSGAVALTADEDPVHVEFVHRHLPVLESAGLVDADEDLLLPALSEVERELVALARKHEGATNW